ncbi:hypothetical protein B0H14DRAFT_3025642 [Mycena olivaceomarginata]|nr:hypothetical protein B0H14DRAFT_3025642 [Mycena olivaceomarginata]
MSPRLQRRRASRQRYEAKYAAKLRMQSTRAAIAEADYTTRRKYQERVAAHSENYRDRLDAAEREHRRIADAESRHVRKLEAESLRKKHEAGIPGKPVKNPASKTPHKAAKKLVLDAPLQKPKPRPLLGPVQRRRRAASSDEDCASDDEEQQGGTQLPLPQLFFEARAPHPARLRCKACGLDDCPGCACMCEVSVRWFDHPGGHFFPDCKSCGGIDCPGVHHRGHLM